MEKKSEKKHFVLVHGFCHGAWCWYKLVNMLKSNGDHQVSTVDLGSCGIHPKRLDEISSISEYVQPLMDFMVSLPDDERVVLVGHSYGGIPISLAMERFPEKISVAVFITAYMPNCQDPPATLIQEYFKRCSIQSLMDSKFTLDQRRENLPISAIFGPDYMTAKVYKGCQIEDLELAKMLIRPNKLFIDELSEKSLLTQGKYGAVRRVYIKCEGDEVLEADFQSCINERSPPNEVISIEGAGHMVMLSKTHDLCLCLKKIAVKYR
ncbi:methylesterase 10 [Olea europaea subsp. europaea]|uniref:Methylesterase 10 n=1 Tax=Olea europaea subsp. europaea TaxID=158383 RepID=A0A8S0RH34_OLEEU|nr:methylesterase 10 [Olea europaea subsp. europaea]